MSEQTNGGPAFSGFAYTEGCGPTRRNSDGELEIYNPGMTLIDYFAGQALAGLLANPGGPVQSNPMSGTGYCNGTVESTAAWAFDIA